MSHYLSSTGISMVIAQMNFVQSFPLIVVVLQGARSRFIVIHLPFLTAAHPHSRFNFWLYLFASNLEAKTFNIRFGKVEIKVNVFNNAFTEKSITGDTRDYIRLKQRKNDPD